VQNTGYRSQYWQKTLPVLLTTPKGTRTLSDSHETAFIDEQTAIFEPSQKSVAFPLPRIPKKTLIYSK
jgi:hypothetical protein